MAVFNSRTYDSRGFAADGTNVGGPLAEKQSYARVFAAAGHGSVPVSNHEFLDEFLKTFTAVYFEW